ncbi:MAG: hypothetical protein C5B48_01145 [Candidatus Rokuibacteriota bacterium]|nr:MAG: hypothetical protein C5B48_01145 [Candidatus Rokubacteria bacterium]
MWHDLRALRGGVRSDKTAGEAVLEGEPSRAPIEKAPSLLLSNGTKLTVRLAEVGVPHTKLMPGRAIKAYYVKRGGENVVTLLEVRGAQPGSGPDGSAG